MQSMIVIPTYNEKENIENLVAEILKLHSDIGILIVDDNSPDGTGQIADALSVKHPENIHVLHRQGKQGLGTAYIAGFKYALAIPDVKYIFEMDADFSHDPKAISLFLDAIKSSDVVQGSRYVPGGKTVNWGISRKIISRGGSLFAKTVLGLPINDVTGGYRCYRRDVLESIDLDNLNAKGYAFQVEMMNICAKKGFSIKEVPITFCDRRFGESKISKKIVIEGFLMVLKMRFANNKKAQ